MLRKYLKYDDWTDIDLIKKLLDKGANKTILQEGFAVYLNTSETSIDTIKKVLDIGLDLEFTVKHDDEDTPLINMVYLKCVEHDNHEMIQDLLSKGAKPDFIFHKSSSLATQTSFTDEAVQFVLEEMLKRGLIGKDSENANKNFVSFFTQRKRTDIISNLGLGKSEFSNPQKIPKSKNNG